MIWDILIGFQICFLLAIARVFVLSTKIRFGRSTKLPQRAWWNEDRKVFVFHYSQGAYVEYAHQGWWVEKVVAAERILCCYPEALLHDEEELRNKASYKRSRGLEAEASQAEKDADLLHLAWEKHMFRTSSGPMCATRPLWGFTMAAPLKWLWSKKGR